VVPERITASVSSRSAAKWKYVNTVCPGRSSGHSSGSGLIFAQGGSTIYRHVGVDPRQEFRQLGGAADPRAAVWQSHRGTQRMNDINSTKGAMNIRSGRPCHSAASGSAAGVSYERDCSVLAG